jgi:DNA-binding MarR family transcriptional regulator
VYTSNEPGTVLCACTTVKKLSRILVRVYDAGLADSGVNITQLAVLRCISRRQGEPLVRVAEELELDRTSLYRAMNPMIRDGWVRVKDGPSSRTRTAVVTKKGQDLLASSANNWDIVQDAIVRKFGRKDYQSLIDELHRLAECAESAEHLLARE